MYKTKNKMFSRENGNLIFNHKYMIFVKYFLFFIIFRQDGYICLKTICVVGNT